MSWTMNEKKYESGDQLLQFVQSDQFIPYADQLKPFVVSIDAIDDDGGHVYGKLSQRKPAWLGEDKLTLVDWENTYSASFMRADEDPTIKQKENLDLLQKIEEAVNAQLNKE